MTATPLPNQPGEPRRRHSMYGIGAFTLALHSLGMDFLVWWLGGVRSETYRHSNLGALTNKPARTDR